MLLLLLGLLLGGLKERIVVHDEVRCSCGGGQTCADTGWVWVGVRRRPTASVDLRTATCLIGLGDRALE